MSFADLPLMKFVHFIQWTQRHIGSDPESRLLGLLMNTRSCLSYDPWDKLFGIMYMLGTYREMSFLKPDYDRSAHELFTDVALFLSDQSGSC